MCRLEKVKNIDLGILSFLELTKDKKYADYKLKIVGSGSQEKRLKSKYGNYENITWEGWTENPNAEYQKTKLFLITSKYEGWGMTAIESVANGTPVVMTNVGCANEFVFNNLNGEISETFKVKDFTNTIKTALKNLVEEHLFTTEKLVSSLKMLQNKAEYLEKLKKVAEYALDNS